MYRRTRFWKKVLHSFGTKSLVMAVALTVVLTNAIGGTLAWLVDETAPLVNTFTYGDINITLTETDTNLDGDDNPNTNSYVMTPGEDIVKNPTVTVLADSKDSWLFVKLEKSENFDAFLTYAIAEGWTALESEPGVYYRQITESNADQAFNVLADDKVTVNDGVTKEMFNQLGSDASHPYPSLTITAYAVQRDADIEAINNVENAWTLAKQNAPETPSA